MSGMKQHEKQAGLASLGMQIRRRWRGGRSTASGWPQERGDK